MLTGKKSKTEIRAERIKQWEAKSGRDLYKIQRTMLARFIVFIRKNKRYYPREIEKLSRDRSEFIRRMRGAISMSLTSYIEYEIGHTRKIDKESNSKWGETIKLLRSAEKIILKAPRSSIISVKTEAGEIAWRHVTWQVQESLAHAIAVSREERKFWELRGVKPSGASLLALELFESLEWCFKREIARNFDISPTMRGYQKNPHGSAPEFVNPDAKLIHLLVTTVETDVTVGHIKQALGRVPTKC